MYGAIVLTNEPNSQTTLVSYQAMSTLSSGEKGGLMSVQAALKKRRGSKQSMIPSKKQTGRNRSPPGDVNMAIRRSSYSYLSSWIFIRLLFSLHGHCWNAETK